MCSLGQGIYEEGVDRGEKLRAVKAAKKLLKLGKITIKEIANCTDLTVDEVRKLEEEMYEIHKSLRSFRLSIFT